MATTPVTSTATVIVTKNQTFSRQTTTNIQQKMPSQIAVKLPKNSCYNPATNLTKNFTANNCINSSDNYYKFSGNFYSVFNYMKKKEAYQKKKVAFVAIKRSSRTT